MKIALFTDGIYPYVIGGMQKHSYLLAKYLARNGIHVDLYHTNQSALDISRLELFSEEEKKYIRSVVIPFPSLGKMPGHYIRESYEYSLAIFREFQKNSDVDLVYAKGFCAWKLLDEKRKGFQCAPVGVNFHGYEMFQKAASFKSKLEQIFLLKDPALFNIKQADFVFSYGGKITDIILGLGVNRKRVIEIPAGIEEEWLAEDVQPAHSPLRFVFVGRYERRKGMIELNAALRKLQGNRPFEFHFIGSVPEDKKILSDKIIYHGMVTDADKMRSLLRGCDVLVCPSHSEGMPNVILEAMASGLAVIATDVGAVSLMVSSENGWLIKKSNAAEVSAALTKAIDASAEDVLLLKKRSLRKVKDNFGWDAIAKRTISGITELKQNPV